jgi:hypothetical protein
LFGIDPKTLRKHYRNELRHGHTKANIRVAENLFRKPTGEGREAVTAAIFWLKTRARWKETSVNEITGPDGGPVSEIRRVIVSFGDAEAKVIDSQPMLADRRRQEPKQ